MNLVTYESDSFLTPYGVIVDKNMADISLGAQNVYFYPSSNIISFLDGLSLELRSYLLASIHMFWNVEHSLCIAPFLGERIFKEGKVEWPNKILQKIYSTKKSEQFLIQMQIYIIYIPLNRKNSELSPDIAKMSLPIQSRLYIKQFAFNSSKLTKVDICG